MITSAVLIPYVHGRDPAADNQIRKPRLSILAIPIVESLIATVRMSSCGLITAMSSYPLLVSKTLAIGQRSNQDHGS